MPTVSAKYLGDLRVECTHVASGTTIVTDAPVDHNGLGRAFSPTDLCATSLAACAMTIMAIHSQAKNVDITGAEMEVFKIMGADPRKIARIEINVRMPARGYSEEEKRMIEHIPEICPVCLTLNPDVQQVFNFIW